MRWIAAICLLLLAGLAGPAAGQAVAPFDEKWLGTIAAHELQQAAQSGNYDELANRLEAVVFARLACGRVDDLVTLNEVVYAWRACRYLPMAGNDELARWLLERREITRLLFRAMQLCPDPKVALANMAELVQTEPKAVQDYPGLAVAFATAQPLEHDPAPPEPADLLQSFRWYIAPDRAFRTDLKTLPFELCHYLADTRLSLAERQWAMDRYGRAPDPAQSYFDIEYDHEHWDRGVPKKIASLPYTLENIRRVGGVCYDQSYFASEVCKAIGIPAAAVRGQGASGIGHSWLARLRPGARGKELEWDTQTARYAAHRYYTGELRDPASGRTMLDAELALLGASARLPLGQLEGADTALTLAKLVEQRQGAAVDLKPLRDLAESYNKQFAAQPDQRRAAIGWVQARRQLDLALTEDLLDSAVTNNLSFAPAWEFILELRRADRIPVEHLNRFFDLVLQKTAQQQPEYSCLLVLRITPTVREPKTREEIYQRAVQLYGKQAALAEDKKKVLQGLLLVAQGDDYRDRGQREQALSAYEQAATKASQVAEIAIPAAAGAERILVQANRRDDAVRMYRRLYDQQSRDGVDSAFREQTARYKLGMRLAQLLRDAGQTEQAEKVLSEIGAS